MKKGNIGTGKRSKMYIQSMREHSTLVTESFITSGSVTPISPRGITKFFSLSFFDILLIIFYIVTIHYSCFLFFPTLF